MLPARGLRADAQRGQRKSAGGGEGGRMGRWSPTSRCGVIGNAKGRGCGPGRVLCVLMGLCWWCGQRGFAAACAREPSGLFMDALGIGMRGEVRGLGLCFVRFDMTEIRLGLVGCLARVGCQTELGRMVVSVIEKSKCFYCYGTLHSGSCSNFFYWPLTQVT